MPSTLRIDVPPRLAVLVTLAQLLERFERSGAPVPPEQYRSVVSHLAQELQAVEHDDLFRRLLDAFPATAELHENLHYAHAGLCRSPLDAAMKAESLAQAALKRASAAA